MRLHRTLPSSLFVLSLLFWPTLAFADGQAGSDAYDQGDYATTLKETKPYTAQGSVRAQAQPSLLYAQGQGVSSDVTPQMDRLTDHGVTPQRNPFLSKGETQEEFDANTPRPGLKFGAWLDAFVKLNPGSSHSEAASIYIGRYGGPPPEDEVPTKQEFFDFDRKRNPSSTDTQRTLFYDRTFSGVLKAIERKKKEQIPWYKLAMRGKPQAQYNLGLLYEQGQGVPQDYAQAIKWYRKAAKQGETSAQIRLGTLHEQGQGVPQDYAQAHMWYNLAAAQGHKAASTNRDQIAEKMSPFQIVEAQRLAREWSPK